jgi:RNA polymerase sigma factor (sigma-70 family)
MTVCQADPCFEPAGPSWPTGPTARAGRDTAELQGVCHSLWRRTHGHAMMTASARVRHEDPIMPGSILGVSGVVRGAERSGVHSMADSPGLVDLVAGAATGDQPAWDQLVERFIPLVRSIARSFRFGPADSDDVAQSVWLRLVEHLGTIREPLALPAWISTTTRNECLTLVRTRRRTNAYTDDVDEGAVIDDGTDPTDNLYREQLRQALLEGLAELPDRHRKLLVLLMADPPIPYDEISLRLDMPKGSIGPTRARALQRLRETQSMAAVLRYDAEGLR